jgi:hypothetical protein
MRGFSLGSLRTRVERLASVCLAAPEPEPMLVHWHWPDDCPSCGAELLTHAKAQVEADARRAAAAQPPPRVVWSSLTACPRCGAALP